MLISNYVGVELSTHHYSDKQLPFVGSQPNDGFETYLAHVMNHQSPTTLDDLRRLEYARSEETYDNNDAASAGILTAGDRPLHESDDIGRQKGNLAGRVRSANPSKEQKLPSELSPLWQKAGGVANRRQIDGDPTNPATESPPRKVFALSSSSRLFEAPQSVAAIATDRKTEVNLESHTGPIQGDHAPLGSEVPDLPPESRVSSADPPSPKANVAIWSPANPTIAEIEVVLQSSDESDDSKRAAVRGQQRPTDKDRKGVSLGNKAMIGDRASNDGLSDDHSRVARRTKIVVRDHRGQSRGSNPSGTESGATTGSARAASGSSFWQGAHIANDQPFDSLMGQKSAEQETVAQRGTESTRPQAQPPTLHSLRQRLNDQINGEIVRSARMVVRGAGTGEIRLHLRPESLGNVRIVLQMHEGHIAGRFIVENSSVREVFEQNMASLVRAFNESGLETGALDVGLAGSGNGSQNRQDSGPTQAAMRDLDRAVPLVQMIEDAHDLVDLIV